VFSAIFAYGELNLRCKLNWLSPAKLPEGSWGEYNLAVGKQQFSYKVISLPPEGGTSIGANIREAQYAHSKADFIAKFLIALKQAKETAYWLVLLFKTNYISEEEYKSFDAACTSIRVMLISSIKTAKETAK
jgi:hypothetical protein